VHSFFEPQVLKLGNCEKLTGEHCSSRL